MCYIANILLQIFPALEKISREASEATYKLEKHKKFIEQINAEKLMQLK